MRTILFLTLLAALIGSSAGHARPETSDEDQIRALEAKESAALLRADVAKLDSLWDDSLTVNSPLNTLTRKADVLARVRDGRISYESFERKIETVLFIADTAVVMGSESGVPSKRHALRIGAMNRRFTNIWVRRNGTWRQAARHASLICE